MLFRSWEACAILPTYEQILTITKFVSSNLWGNENKQTVKHTTLQVRK
jgi:hypothetical protein